MKIIIDTENNQLILNDGHNEQEIRLYSKDSFDIISDLWTKVGWNEKYSYTFSWMGRPIIQLPEDMIRVQEVIYHLRPDVIIETGIAHGGSLIYYASLCKAMDVGRVIGIDINIKPENRQGIEKHSLSSFITLIEGDSVAENTVNKVKSLINKNEIVLVILDSAHSKGHVAKELELYHPLVTEGSYIIVTDGIMKNFYDVPRGKEEWMDDNPVSAVVDFEKRYPEFILEEPQWIFNESYLDKNVTHWPSGWLKKKKKE